MAMLDRYKKTGGFVQLLILLETSGKQKQQKFLEIIRQEDARWAAALTAKMVSLERVLSWNESALSEITGAMLEINLASLLHALSIQQRELILASLGSIKRKKVLDFHEASEANPAEIAVSVGKMLETVRKLSQDGTLRFERIDPSMQIEDDIENKLRQGMPIEGVNFKNEPELGNSSSSTDLDSSNKSALRLVNGSDGKTAADTLSKSSGTVDPELIAMRKKVAQLQGENATLRHELSVAQQKLEQIRKIA
jgi:hypothetical protein